MDDKIKPPQFWPIDFAPDPNHSLNIMNEAANDERIANPGEGKIILVGLAEETAGGIVGYVNPNVADMLGYLFPVTEDNDNLDPLFAPGLNKVQREALEQAFHVAGQLQDHARERGMDDFDTTMGDLLSELDRIKRGKED